MNNSIVTNTEQPVKFLIQRNKGAMPVRKYAKLRRNSIDEQVGLSSPQLQELTHGKPVYWEHKIAPFKSIVEGKFYLSENRRQSLMMPGGMTSLSRYAAYQPVK